MRKPFEGEHIISRGFLHLMPACLSQPLPSEVVSHLAMMLGTLHKYSLLVDFLNAKVPKFTRYTNVLPAPLLPQKRCW